VNDAQRVVGRYEIVREIGRGGMATVDLARQIDLDRLVALKELRALRSDDDPSVARRFLREARLAGSLSHPNIVTVYEYFEADGVPHIAMEYMAQGSLRPWVGRLSPAQVGYVLEGLLAGLAEAERHDVVHRDIKPENLLVTGDGGVKIADFGIAKATNALEQTALLTSTGMTVGTPNYIAPEQAMAGQLGPWTDLYSVGVTTFELLVGRTPFGDSQEPMAIVLRQINEQVPPLTTFIPNADPWLSQWIEWLVAKDPARRPQSARQAWEGLEETLIRLLGPRWRRNAQVPVAPLSPPVVPSSPRTAADPRLAATTPPRRRPTLAPPPVEPVAPPAVEQVAPPAVEQVAPRAVDSEAATRRRRRGPIAATVGVLAGLLTGAAMLFGRGLMRLLLGPRGGPRRRRRRRLIPARLAVLAAALTAGVILFGKSGGGSPSSPASQTVNGVAAPEAAKTSTAATKTSKAATTTSTGATTPSTDAGSAVPAGAASQARKLAKSYRRAKSQLAGQKGAGVAELRAALGDTAAAYDRVAAAAATGDVPTYEAAVADAAIKRQALAAIEAAASAPTRTAPQTTTAAPPSSNSAPAPSKTAPSATTPASGAPTNGAPAPTAPTTRAPTTTAQTNTGPITPPGPCSGDSVSDDPSDDACGP
jgi:serine/threonine protein kinase